MSIKVMYERELPPLHWICKCGRVNREEKEYFMGIKCRNCQMMLQFTPVGKMVERLRREIGC